MPYQRCYVSFPSRLIDGGGLASGGPHLSGYCTLSLDMIVLLISENDLRSALTARLTMIGMNVVTIGADQLAQGMFGTAIKTAILVTDDGSIGQAASEASPAWLQVVILNGSSGDLDDRPVRLSRRGATRRLVEILDGWRAPQDSTPPLASAGPSPSQ